MDLESSKEEEPLRETPATKKDACCGRRGKRSSLASEVRRQRRGRGAHGRREWNTFKGGERKKA